jgi:hypothetical protein
MKTTLLPLVILTAAASAQTMPVKSVNKSEQFSVGVSYAMAKNTLNGAPVEIDSDATVIDVRATVYPNIFLTASYADIKTDIPSGLAPEGPDNLDMNSYSFGFGTKIAAGNGNFELAYAYSKIEADYSSENINQNIFKAGYSVDVGNGLNVGLSVIYYSNSDAGGVDDVFAPVFTVGYKFGQGFSADLSYSTENTAFGAPDADGTTTIGVRYGF